MLICEDDVSNDVIIVGTCFSLFVNICARFRFALIGGNLTAQSMGSHGGILLEVEFKFQRRGCKLSFLFPPRRWPERRGELARRLIILCNSQHISGYVHSIPNT